MMSFLSGFVGSSDCPEGLLYLPGATHSLSCFFLALWYYFFLTMAMAQEGTIDLPSTRHLPSPQHTQCPDQYQPSKKDNRAREIVSQNCGEVGSHYQENARVDAANNLDDEVQFVFSVPRRRRKRRKRYDGDFSHLHAMLTVFIGLGHHVGHQVSCGFLKGQQVPLPILPLCIRPSVEEAQVWFSSWSHVI
jgi:hypothetical protein